MEALWLPSRESWLWLGSSPCPASPSYHRLSPSFAAHSACPSSTMQQRGCVWWDSETPRQAVSLPPSSVTLGHVLEDLPMVSACSGKPSTFHIWVMVVFSYPWQERHKSCTATSSQFITSNLACADNHLLLPSPLAVPPPPPASLTFPCLHITARSYSGPDFHLSPPCPRTWGQQPTQHQGLQF